MRLIDADDLTSRVWFVEFQGDDIDRVSEQIIKQCKEIVRSAPPVDAVPVVRCKECRHMYRTIFAGSIYNNCGKRTEHVELGGYCEQGER